MANVDAKAGMLANRLGISVEDFPGKAAELKKQELESGLNQVQFSILQAINSYLKAENHSEILKNGGQDRAEAGKALDIALQLTKKK